MAVGEGGKTTYSKVETRLASRRDEALSGVQKVLCSISTREKGLQEEEEGEEREGKERGKGEEG